MMDDKIFHDVLGMEGVSAGPFTPTLLTVKLNHGDFLKLSLCFSNV